MKIQHERLPVNLEIVDHADFTRDLRVIIDWVSLTFSHRESFKRIEDDNGNIVVIPDLQIAYDLLGMTQDQFTEKNGLMSYKKSMRNGHIMVLYDGTFEQGIHVVISGQGCREYEQHYIERLAIKRGFDVWRSYFCDALSLGANFTRIDLAIDDFTPYFPIRDLWKRFKNKTVTSKFKKARCIEGIDIGTGEELGFTIYVGSQQSSVELCMYAKDLERESKGMELDPSIKAWNRIEIRCYDERCYSLAHSILERNDIGEVALGILHNYISFLEEDKNDSNKSRWRLWRKWAKFLGGVEKLKLTHVAPDRTIERSIAWIEDQVIKTLGEIFLADNGSLKRVHDWVYDGAEKAENCDKSMAKIKRYQERKAFTEKLTSNMKNMSNEELQQALLYILDEKKELDKEIESTEKKPIERNFTI